MCDLNGPELVSLANALAVLVSKNLNSKELSLLAAFFTSFADNLALLSIQKD